MLNSAYYKGRKIVVVGLARSGIACANLLFDLGAKVSVTDSKDDESTRALISQLRSGEIKVELGIHSGDFIKQNELMIISPGVAFNGPPVLIAQEHRIPVISEIEFASGLCPAKIIAVTGSNGKTTVTTLIGSALQANGLKAHVLGNIGLPFSQSVAGIQPDDYVVLEVSSFQLERINKFRPKIALILNFSGNHLDRYKDLEEYLTAKKRIFLNQDGNDYLITDGENPLLNGLDKEARSKVVFFTRSRGLNPNQSVVLEVAKILNLDREKVIEVFREFKGIRHRMEFVDEVNGVRFINDSKSTTAASTVWALKNIDSPVILIAGGKDKGVDYSLILPLAAKKVKEIILIGEAKEKIKAALGNAIKIREAVSLREAVIRAYQGAGLNDTILLSPMCSSFDMFSNYEERGESFKRAVENLANL